MYEFEDTAVSGSPVEYGAGTADGSQPSPPPFNPVAETGETRGSGLDTTPPVPSAVPTDIREQVERQRAALLERDRQPVIRSAFYDQACASCRRRIKANDQIANPLGIWVHLVCAVCAVCGGWVDAEAVEAPGGIGKVHRACQATPTT